MDDDHTTNDEDDLEIRVLETPADLRRLVALFNQVWGTITPIVGIELLRAIGHTGGYVAGAFAKNRMVGGSLAFLCRHHGDVALHSHITGILPGVRQTGLGRQMKLHQRAWAGEQGLDWITWTFDPLVRRNAWFNIGVLGAQIDAYLVDFYGQMDDAINGRDPSDRLLVAWSTAGDAPDHLTQPPVPPGAVTVPTPGRHRRDAAHGRHRSHDVAAASPRGARRPAGERWPRGRVHAGRRVRGAPGARPRRRVTGR